MSVSVTLESVSTLKPLVSEPLLDEEPLVMSWRSKLGLEPIYTEPVQCKLHQGFTFPIEYLDASEIHAVDNSVAADLEFSWVDGSSTVVGGGSSNKNMTHHLCESFIHGGASASEKVASNPFAETVSQEMARLYTSNIDFLQQTQEVVESTTDLKHHPLNCNRFREIWNDIKEDAAFLEKHSFMEWKALEELNRSRTFLQIYSIMNILSPLFSIVLPIVILIFPFVLLKIKGLEVTFQQYIETLKEIAKSHFIGKALSIQHFSMETMLYFLFIFGVYALQMYQNVNACFRYYHSVRRMNENLCDLYGYLDASIDNMHQFVTKNRSKPLYKSFCDDVWAHQLTLMELKDRIGGNLTRFCLNPRKLLDLGKMLEIYYVLYSNIEYEEALRYSVGFEGYVSTIRGVYQNYSSGILGKCSFSTELDDVTTDADSDQSDDDDFDTPKYSVFRGQYYPPHLAESSRVPNDMSLAKNRIITGVNASGKTTTLKTTAINILVSQQYGFGFYERATVVPVHHIHSYLNIPDTSGRDSLFQAESRRCKHILDKIRTSAPDSRHFCLFDELYSGTNPKEATKSAVSLLKFLAARPNVRFVLTTHYVDVCKSLEENKRIENWKMNVEVNETTGRIDKYTYQMSRGISVLEGGIEILKNMDYPDEILKDMESKSDSE